MTDTPGWLADAAGGTVVAAGRARWGFRHETWIVDLADGRRTVLQRRIDGSDPTTPAAATLRALVRAAGLPVPEPVRRTISANGDHEVVVELPYVDAPVAAELLGTRDGAANAGQLCGSVAARISTVRAPDGVHDTWASPDRLVAAVNGWRAAARPPLSPTADRALLSVLERAATTLGEAPPRLAHGDLAPVNVLVRGDSVAAVLDLDRARLAHPAYDAAWFSWVVSFHHPEVAGRACAAFGKAAGTPADTGDVAWLWPLLLLERLVEASGDRERTSWSERLGASLAMA